MSSPGDGADGVDEENTVAREVERNDAMVAEALDRLAGSDEADAFLAVLDRYLRVSIHRDTFAFLTDAAGPYLPAEVMVYFATAATERPEDRFEAFDQIGLSSAGRAFARRVIALYGREIELAWNLWPYSGNADDWKRVRREVMRDLVTGQYVVSLDFEKKSGEWVLFRGEPESILRMARVVISAIVSIGDREVLESEAADELFDVLGRLTSLRES